MLGLTKGRAIGFYLLCGVLTFMTISILLLEKNLLRDSSQWLMIGLLLFTYLFLYVFFRYMDNEDKIKKYEKLGYSFLDENEKGEKTYFLFSEPGKIFKDARILIAIFDEKGYLKHSSILNKEDIKIASKILEKREC